MALTQTRRRDPVEHGDPAADLRAFRRALGQFTTGVTVITTVADGRPVGVTANSFASLSLDPPLVLWSIAASSRSFAAFKTAAHFAVNILGVEQIHVSQHFASLTEDKFDGIEWEAGGLGSPILPEILAVLECETETVLPGGDHLILVGRVRRFTRYHGDALLYAQGRYAVAGDHPSLITRPQDETSRETLAKLTAELERPDAEEFLGIPRQDLDTARRVIETIYERVNLG